MCLTCNNSRYPPADGIVEAHMAVVDVSDFSEHTVNMQTLHKRPGKCAHVEVVQKDGYYGTYKLERERERERELIFNRNFLPNCMKTNGL